MDGEGRRFLADRFLDLRLPAGASRKIVLVEPYPQPGGARIGAIEEPALQFPGSGGVRA
jgi:hypothetical protein